MNLLLFYRKNISKDFLKLLKFDFTSFLAGLNLFLFSTFVKNRTEHLSMNTSNLLLKTKHQLGWSISRSSLAGLRFLNLHSAGSTFFKKCAQHLESHRPACQFGSVQFEFERGTSNFKIWPRSGCRLRPQRRKSSRIASILSFFN